MSSPIAAADVEARINEFIEKTKALDGKEVRERTQWNFDASADAIRHFAFGIGDDNPLWIDPDYAKKTRYGRLVAPPGFLCSVMYPILHGAPMLAPLSSLIGGVEYRFGVPVLEGDRLLAVPRQKETYEKKSGSGRRLIFVISEITYTNQRNEVVGTATGTMIRATQVGEELLFERPLYRYSQPELDEIGKAIRAETRTGGKPLKGSDVKVGQEIPTIVRGPLTIGDMVCWQAAIGPSYRAAGLGYLDCLKAPHAAVKNPVTGWPVKYSQQHEDPHLAAQRGMPGPFDNGVMRFAWVSPLITNWMGDAGVLKRLYVQVRKPHIYADTIWYSGKVVEKSEQQEGTLVKIAIRGTDQLGAQTTGGDADVLLPSR
ncbi:MAG: MaoC family dehydratase N-terminal domain-containing protein [Candidatus Lambdaproteobacteria bacterium]|nr:MaoC family dehydratase N-terminal domain-containing protein [Candidatus Lambdaproteobacteria bacterium]